MRRRLPYQPVFAKHPVRVDVGEDGFVATAASAVIGLVVLGSVPVAGYFLAGKAGLAAGIAFDALLLLAAGNR